VRLIKVNDTYVNEEYIVQVIPTTLGYHELKVEYGDEVVHIHVDGDVMGTVGQLSLGCTTEDVDEHANRMRKPR